MSPRRWKPGATRVLRPPSIRPVRALSCWRPAGALFAAASITIASADLEAAELLVGKAVAIADGDTITVLVNHQPLRVRVAEIDAPERGQAFGQRSRQALAALCIRQAVTVESQARDRYGRVVGRVECAGADAAHAQVAAGLAWVYEKYAPAKSPLRTLQADAQTARRGLWADPEPVPPWAYRATAPSGTEAARTGAAAGVPITAAPGASQCSGCTEMLDELLPLPRNDLSPDATCGARGGPGFRRPDGRCAGWNDW